MANDSGAAVLVMQRLCLVLASIAAAEGAGAGADLVQYACQLAQPETTVQVVQSIAVLYVSQHGTGTFKRACFRKGLQ